MSEPRRIILVTDPLPEAKQTEFLNWLRTFGAGWAHYMAGGWFIALLGPSPTADQIVNKLWELSPGLQCLAFELGCEPVAYCGFLNLDVIEGAKKWLREQWRLNVK